MAQAGSSRRESRRGRRSSRLRRFGRAVVQTGRRRGGRGGVEAETPGQVVGEAAAAARRLFRRNR